MCLSAAPCKTGAARAEPSCIFASSVVRDDCARACDRSARRPLCLAISDRVTCVGRTTGAISGLRMVTDAPADQTGLVTFSWGGLGKVSS